MLIHSDEEKKVGERSMRQKMLHDGANGPHSGEHPVFEAFLM